MLKSDNLKEYLSSVYKTDVELRWVGELGKKLRKPERELKGFGYGVPYLVEFAIEGEMKRVVLGL